MELSLIGVGYWAISDRKNILKKAIYSVRSTTLQKVLKIVLLYFRRCSWYSTLIVGMGLSIIIFKPQPTFSLESAFNTKGAVINE